MKPPAWTCPGIDAALHTSRRIRWRLRTGRLVEEVPGLLVRLEGELERVRVENAAVREWGRWRNAGETGARAGVGREMGGGVVSDVGEGSDRASTGVLGPVDSLANLTTRRRTG